jgi:hypothetical protein
MTDEPLEAQIDRLLGRHSAVVGATARALRSAVLEAAPESVEEVDFGNKLIAYGSSMKMRDLTFAIIPHSAHVNLQLADGVDLPDPKGLIEGTGKRIRHVKVRSVEAARSAEIKTVIDAQLQHRR